MHAQYTIVASPVGGIWVAWCEEGLLSVGFENQRQGAQLDPGWELAPNHRCDATEQLEAYFAGELRQFELQLTPRGTPFQRRVWRELETIGYGETTTYGAIAARLGKPTASRAVGAANGQNPIAIVVPCHRVIGKNGKLTGYAGGLEIKEQLLRLERGFSPS